MAATTGWRQIAFVLNALRHQRFGTQQAQGANPLPEVLNALRHQRFGTIEVWEPRIDLDTCSTPYGIRGLARR